MGCFDVIAKDGGCSARRGLLRTGHGSVETPVFMPVGTRGSVKGLTPEQLAATGARIVLANTYHMMIRPGIEVVESLETPGLGAKIQEDPFKNQFKGLKVADDMAYVKDEVTRPGQIKKIFTMKKRLNTSGPKQLPVYIRIRTGLYSTRPAGMVII